MAVPLPQAAAIPEPIATQRLTVGSAVPLVLDQLRQAGAGPFLDLPLPQLPAPSELPAPQAPAPGAAPRAPDLSHRFAPQAHNGTAPTSAAPPAAQPQLPPNPVEQLTQGLHIPDMPGVDQMMSPLLGLLKSFGSGILGAVNPAHILQEGAQVMEGAMQVGGEALAALMQSWQGGAAQAAHTSGQQAADQGNAVGGHGKTIADITNKAADQVNRGYQQLNGIVRDFAAQVVPIAATGAILTPPGQSALMGVATAAFGRATVVVSQVQAALAGLSADLNAAGGLIQVLENSGVDLPTMAAQAVEVAQPAVSKMGDALSGAFSAQDVSAEGPNISDAPPYGGDPGADQITAASYPGDPMVQGGGLAAGLDGRANVVGDFGGGGGFGGASDDGGPPAAPTLGGVPTLGGAPAAPSAPGTGGSAALGSPVLPASTTGNTGTTGGAPQGGSASVGGVAPAAAAARGAETQHHRSVQPYQTTEHRVAPAGVDAVAPAVLGAEDPEADARLESEYGYYSDPDGDRGR